jgi:hypothetical protein
MKFEQINMMHLDINTSPALLGLDNGPVVVLQHVKE